MTDQDQPNLARGIADPCLDTTDRMIMEIPDPVIRAHRIGLQLAMEHVILLYDEGDDVDSGVKIEFSKELLSGLVRPEEINARLLQGGQAVFSDGQTLQRITAAIDALTGWRPVGSGSVWAYEGSREIVNDNTICRLEMAVDKLEKRNKIKSSLPKGVFDLDVESVAKFLILKSFGRHVPDTITSTGSSSWKILEELAEELLSGCRSSASDDEMGGHPCSRQLGALIEASLKVAAPNEIKLIWEIGNHPSTSAEYALRSCLHQKVEEELLSDTYTFTGPLGHVARPMINHDEPSVTRLRAWREAWRDGMQDHAYGRLLQALNLK